MRRKLREYKKKGNKRRKGEKGKRGNNYCDGI